MASFEGSFNVRPASSAYSGMTPVY